MTADLKPCPFCGSTQVEPVYSSWEFYRVDCAQCGTSGPRADVRGLPFDEQSAVEALACERWNRRAEGGVCGSMPPITHTHRHSGSVCKAYHEQVVAKITAERDRARADFDNLKAEWNLACAVGHLYCNVPNGKSILIDGIPALAHRVKELETEVERLNELVCHEEGSKL